MSWKTALIQLIYVYSEDVLERPLIGDTLEATLCSLLDLLGDRNYQDNMIGLLRRWP